MPPNNNAARRVYELLEKAAAAQDKVPAVNIWADIFGIAESEERPYEVAQSLSRIKDELDSVRGQMAASEIGAECYERYLRRARAAVGVETLSQHWGNLKPNLTNETLLALRWCSEVMPNEEDVIDPKQLAELEQLANQLSESLQAATLPTSLRSLIERHLVIICHALRWYPIQGAKVFNDAIRAGMATYVDMPEAQAIIQANGNSEAVAKWKAFWDRVRVVTEPIIRTNKTLEAGYGLWMKAHATADFVKNLLPGP